MWEFILLHLFLSMLKIIHYKNFVLNLMKGEQVS